MIEKTGIPYYDVSNGLPEISNFYRHPGKVSELTRRFSKETPDTGRSSNFSLCSERWNNRGRLRALSSSRNEPRDVITGNAVIRHNFTIPTRKPQRFLACDRYL